MDGQSLDLSRLLFAHTGLTLVSATSSASPSYNFPLSLYGLVIINRENQQDGGDSDRQFALLIGASFIFDLFWFMSSDKSHASSLSLLCLMANVVLKPITLLALLGHLRQRGEPTFSFPTTTTSGGFSLPGGFPGSGGRNGSGGNFPPRASETVWQAPTGSGLNSAGVRGGGGYHAGFPEDDDDDEDGAGDIESSIRTPLSQPRTQKNGMSSNKGAGPQAPPPPPPPPASAEGGGYHTLE